MKTSLEHALILIKACEAKALEICVPCVITVVDQGGHLIAAHRMDGAVLGCIQISSDKAYTALAFQVPTHELALRCQPGQELYGFHTINGGKFVVFGGGYPILDGNEVIGAVGVSGGTVVEDKQIAEAGLEVFHQGEEQ